MVEALQENPLVVAVGQALIAFLWQGTAVALVAALLFRALRGRDPRWRYAVACLALVVMVGLPIRTTLTGYEPPSPTKESAPAASSDIMLAAASAAVPEEAEPGALGDSSASAVATIGAVSRDGWIQTIVALWFLGVVGLSLRLAGGWVLVKRMAAQGTPVDAALSARIRSIASRLRLRQPIVARRSSSVVVPTVVGWLKPTILLPASAMTGLDPEQIEALLAHELAHIRRHDYGINVLQRLAETLLFYHPAVWWLSNRIRAEREMCADDLAVSVCGDPALYAGALRDLEAARTRNALAVAATGGSLPARVRRLLGQPPVRDRWAPVWTFVFLTSVFVVVAVGAPTPTTMAAQEIPLALQEAAIPAVSPIPATAQESNPEDETPPAEPEEIIVVATVPPIEPEAASQTRVQVVQAIQDDATEGVTGGVSGIGGAFLRRNYQSNLISPSQQIVSQTPLLFAASRQGSYLGLQITDGETEGALVQSVVEDSPAAEAGIQAGDLITEFAGTPVLGARQLTRMVEETPDGRRVPLTLLRDGETRNVEVTVEGRAPVAVLGDPFERYQDALENYQKVSPGISVYRMPGAGTIRLGLRIENMTPELREFFGAPEDRGVLVSSVVADSPAAEAGMRVGDVIVSIDGNDVSSPAQLTRSTELDDATVVLEVIRDGRSQEVRVTLDLPARSLRIAP